VNRSIIPEKKNNSKGKNVAGYLKNAFTARRRKNSLIVQNIDVEAVRLFLVKTL